MSNRLTFGLNSRIHRFDDGACRSAKPNGEMKLALEFGSLSLSRSWNLLVEAAKRAARENGYALSRLPGRGLSNVWHISKNGDSKVASIRTTRDRWIAFPP